MASQEEDNVSIIDLVHKQVKYSLDECMTKYQENELLHLLINKKIEYIYFTNYYNCNPLCNHGIKSQLLFIPDQVISISINSLKPNYNILDILPSKLKFLSIEAFNFTKPLDHLPLYLEYLKLPVNYPFTHVQWTSNLKYLVINCDLDLSDLPPSLEYLHISSCKITRQIKNLPANLKKLDIYADNQCIVENLPENLEALEIFSDHKPIIQCSLPEKLQYLNIDSNLYQNIIPLIFKYNQLELKDSNGEKRIIYETKLKKLVVNLPCISMDDKMSYIMDKIPFLISKINIKYQSNDDGSKTDVELELYF
jgi:hypothetical protein